jgi:mono/diheme cytochrome c family protein
MKSEFGATIECIMVLRFPSPTFLRLVSLLLLAVEFFPAGFALKPVGAASASNSVLPLYERRNSSLDLEVAGDLAGQPVGSVRYIWRDDLLKLPQVNLTVTDDANFKSPTQISGILLEALAKHVSANPQSDLIVAICSDKYRANYPRAYIAAHHPLLVLTVNGKPPEDWPKAPEGLGLSMGPYLISHAKFVPSFKVLSHSDEPQIPWGVVRLEFRNEQKVLSAIAPRGPHAHDPEVQNGYRIAQQNCFRCHNMSAEGGTKAGRSWLVLATWANSAPDHFSAYVRDPKAKNPHAQMPGNPHYDDATLKALVAYFRTFYAEDKQ